MADIIVSPLLMHLNDRLNDLEHVIGSKVWRKIRLNLEEIQTLVVDAENSSGETTVMKRFWGDVKHVAYDTEDLIDEYLINLPGNKVYKLKTMINKICSLCGHSVFRSKIQELEITLDGVARTWKAQSSNFAVMPAEEGVDSIFAHRTTISFIDESAIFGRDSDREAIVKLLLDQSCDDNSFSVVSIVGMGGIGKTTLAQLAFNDESVRRHFDLMVWVCVSDEFNLIRIVREILEAATLQNYDISLSNLDVLAIKLSKVLRNKKFLIVLDDLWTQDFDQWSTLRSLFSVGDLGSKVLLTTRIADVAFAAGGIQPYYLGCLPLDESWALFRSISLSPFPSRDNTNFEDIGRRIVKKCQGLPIAVRTLAGLLRFKTKESEWLSILNHNTWDLEESTSNVLNALKLSYNHLPAHLKQCFAFCSVFPKEYTINKTKLINCWIANGFVKSTSGTISLEEMGERYFHELLQRSFFAEAQRNEDDDIAACRMHDLIHDLACWIAGNWCAVVETENSQYFSSFELHHASLCFPGESSVPEKLHQAKKLRTLLLISGECKYMLSVFNVFRFLRVLDLSCSDLHELPASVAQLKHLRYLDLSSTRIRTLPRSIGKIHFLEILELFACYNLHELPKAISQLTNLKHLGIQSCPLLSHMPSGIGKLRLLQTLPTFILSENDGCGCLSDLSGLNLRGRLEITHLEHAFPKDANNAEICKKLGLNSLRLSWDENFDPSTSLEVLKSLCPPEYLKVLDITGYGGSMFPSWLCDIDMHLVKLSLINCRCPELPPLGQLPNLKHLHMKGLSEVHTIGKKFYVDKIVGRFPSLKELELYNLPNLSEWKGLKLEGNITLIEMEETLDHLSEVSFPCLEALSIKGCTRLTELPLLPSLRKLALSNCNTALLGSLAHLTSLSSLVIDEFREPMPLSTNMGYLNSIKTLIIYDCDYLISLMDESLPGFSSLEHLSILSCDKLESLPTGLRYLTSLQKLKIVDCQELVNIPDISDLSSCPEIVVKGCPNVIALRSSHYSP